MPEDNRCVCFFFFLLLAGTTIEVTYQKPLYIQCIYTLFHESSIKLVAHTRTIHDMRYKIRIFRSVFFLSFFCLLWIAHGICFCWWCRWLHGAFIVNKKYSRSLSTFFLFFSKIRSFIFLDDTSFWWRRNVRGRIHSFRLSHTRAIVLLCRAYILIHTCTLYNLQYTFWMYKPGATHAASISDCKHVLQELQLHTKLIQNLTWDSTEWRKCVRHETG